jgi:hypothetical protein
MTDRTPDRRKRGAGTVPAALAAWFAGEPLPGHRTPPWSAILWPWKVLIFERWRAFAAMHPGAKPPTGYEWIGGAPPKSVRDIPAGMAAAPPHVRTMSFDDAVTAAKAQIRRATKKGISL